MGYIGYDGFVYDVNRRNLSTKPPFTIGQEVKLKKLKGTCPGQKGEIVRDDKSLVGSSKRAAAKNSNKENMPDLNKDRKERGRMLRLVSNEYYLRFRLESITYTNAHWLQDVVTVRRLHT